MLWHVDQTKRIEIANRKRIRAGYGFASQVRQQVAQWADEPLDRIGGKFESLRARSREDCEHFEQNFVDAVALICCAIRQIFGFDLHDVQIAGAAAAASGAIIEMQTGEGKTIVCGTAALIRSIFDTSVHVATTTDYLAERDHEENKKLFQALRTSSAVLQQNATHNETRAAYRCNITYGPGYLFGFDYLREQVTLRKAEELVLGRDVLQQINGSDLSDQLAQHTHQTILIDEADSVLIDEATTPLILSEPNPELPQEMVHAFGEARQLAAELLEPEHFEIDDANRKINLTDAGSNEIYRLLRGRDTELFLDQPWSNYICNALYAEHFLTRDEHYVVREGSIQLVDQFTGRIFEDRQLRGGLHQAVEAKERVKINPPNLVTGRLTRQRYFQLYENVAGMTGTITGSEKEIEHFYDVPIAPFNPHRPSLRKELPSRFFDTWQNKLNAIAAEVAQRHQTGQPILIGTRTIRESHWMAEVLRAEGVSATILNGVQDEAEADIVARAGQRDALVIATNMAGRGTDIKLTQETRELGGLHVICTQRHASARVDRQLVGRCARQGDPGSFQFFISADDDLFDLHAPELGRRIQRAARSDGEARRDFTPEILKLQRDIEQQQFELRRSLVRQDHWMDQIRDTMVSHS